MGSDANPNLLITGGSGYIGSLLAVTVAGHYRTINLDWRSPPPGNQLPHVKVDITAFDHISAHFQGIDIVLHLAADPRPQAPWESLLPHNIMATRNVLEAARVAGCRRVIIASSIMTVVGYPAAVYVRGDMPPKPNTLYGISKAWCESLGRCYALESDLSVLCLRIGGVVKPRSPRLLPWVSHLDRFVTPRDLIQFLHCALTASPAIQFGVFHGLSKRRGGHFDLEEARQVLGYIPENDTYALACRNFHGMLLWARKKARGNLKKPSQTRINIAA